MSDSAIEADEFTQLMAALGLHPEEGAVAVAVSGGADSMALCLLAHQWGDVLALTVDHGLRPESADEARQVGIWLEGRGIPHEVLHWEGDKPQSGIQEAARDARYSLLQNRCRMLDIDRLLLAHHLDDQAETFLLRLARGSGLWGLAAMAPIAPPLGLGDDQSPRRYRPLLNMPKSRLIATCRAFRQNWVEDPSNDAAHYDRTSARQMLLNPPLPGLTAKRLADTAQRLSQARDALDHYLDLLWSQCIAFGPYGEATVSLSALKGAPKELQLRLLSRLFRLIAGRIHPPRIARIKAALSALYDSDFRGLTVSGCQIIPSDIHHVLICREPAACSDVVQLEHGRWTLWDGRFQFLLENGSSDVTIKALGEDGWRRLCREQPEIRTAAPPYPIILALPSLWRHADLIAVPHLGYETESAGLKMKAVLPDWAKQRTWEENPRKKSAD